MDEQFIITTGDNQAEPAFLQRQDGREHGRRDLLEFDVADEAPTQLHLFGGADNVVGCCLISPEAELMGNLCRIDADEEITADGRKTDQTGIDRGCIIRGFPAGRIHKLHDKNPKNEL